MGHLIDERRSSMKLKTTLISGLLVCMAAGTLTFASCECWDTDSSCTDCKGTDGESCNSGTYQGKECWVCNEIDYLQSDTCRCVSGSTYTACDDTSNPSGTCYKTRTVWRDKETGETLDSTAWSDTSAYLCITPK